MAASRKLTVEILGDAKGAQGAFKQVADGTDTLGEQFTNFGKKVGLIFAAIGTGAALFAKSALGAAYEAQKVTAQTEAIIKATGKAAGLTSDQIGKLAESLSNKTGIDDEAIQSSMNMLLTFKQVRDEAGKGNDIFRRASGAMLDLGNVFGSTDSAAMQLGKALSDPVKGISALRRAGVNFSEAQQKQIKAFVESGDLLSAQKMILAEVESQVGGTAAATATSADRMKVAYENLKERIGVYLVPVFESFARTITEKVIPAISDFINRYGPKLADFFKGLWEKIEPVVSGLTKALLPILKKIGDWMSDNTEVVATFFGVIAGISVIASLAALASTLAALFNPITLIIGAIAAVAAGFVYAYKHFETFRNIVDGVAQFIIDVVVPAVAGAFSWLADQVSAFVGGIRTRWDDIKTATKNVFDFITLIATTAFGALQWLWDTFGATIVGSIKRTWDAVSQMIIGAFTVVKGIFDVFIGLLSGNWGRAWDGLKEVVSGVLKSIMGIALALWNPIVSTFSGIWAAVKAAAVAPFTALVGIVKGAINILIDVVNKFIDIWNKIQFTAPKIHIPGTNLTVGGFTLGFPDLPRIPHLAEGGIVMSPSIVQIAEREPEAVIPLSKLGTGKGDTNVVIHVSGADPSAVVDALKRYYRQNGAIPIRTVSP